MRRIRFTFALIFSFALAPLATFALDTPTTFAFHGSGYGHGVGLSQMGAKSMALAGATSDEILQSLADSNSGYTNWVTTP